MKRIDKTGFGNLVIVQDDELFCYGVDAVILADFASAKRNDEVMDLCTGNGIIPFILAHKYGCKKIYGLEIQEDSIALAEESLEKNADELDEIGSHIEFFLDDANEVKEFFEAESCSLVTCNPPYFEEEKGVVGEKDAKRIARFESSATLEDFLSASAYLLKGKGRLCMIHRPERLCDIFELMRKYDLEPKRMRLVQDTPDSSPRMVMIEAVKGAKKQLSIMPSLIVHGDVQGYSEEIQKIYERV